MAHASANVNHQGVRLAADYLKTLTEKYVRLPKVLDFLFRFSVDSVTTVPSRSTYPKASGSRVMPSTAILLYPRRR
jgi:hypothetical protein